MNQNCMKKLIVLPVFLFLSLSQALFTTMGDSTTVNGKTISFYGKLETYTVQTKRVEHITFWNRQLKTQLFQAPNSVITMITAEQSSKASDMKEAAEEEFVLSENPATQGIVATVELREIQSLSTPRQKKIIYKENDKIMQEFIVIEITLHDAKGVYYLADKGDKLYCKEQSGKETVELEVPLTSIKMLTIEGFVTANQSGS